MRKALSRERLEFHGETLELPLPDGPGKALKLTISPVQERIPIYLAAIGPKNTALAGEIADGWIPTFFSPEHVSELRALLEEGAARSGRSLDGFDMAPTVNAYISDDREAARNLMRPILALYIGGMGSRNQNFYNKLVQRYGFEDAAKEVQDLYLDGKREEAGAAIPDELIDMVSLCGPRDVVRDRLAAFRDAGVGTLMVSPMAFTRDRPDRAAAGGRRAGGLSAAAERLLFLGAFGDPGHAFPMLALGARLAARGHEVMLETWTRWREHVEAEGMRFVAGARVPGVPHPRAAAEALRGGRAGDRARRGRLVARARARRGRARHPHARAGAGRRARGHAGRDAGPPRVPARRARLAALRGGRAAAAHARSGARLWARSTPLVRRGLQPGRAELNETRARLGLRAAGAPARRESASGCAWSRTFPQLEYPRRVAGARARRRAAAVGAAVRRGGAAAGRRAAGAGGAVDRAGPRAPAAARRARRAWPDEPVRVLATWNRRPPATPSRCRANARLVEWVSYSQTMPACELVICHAGHGTLVRALACGCPVVVRPARRRHGRERGAGRLGRGRGPAAVAAAEPGDAAAGGAGARWRGRRSLSAARAGAGGAGLGSCNDGARASGAGARGGTGAVASAGRSGARGERGRTRSARARRSAPGPSARRCSCTDRPPRARR